MHTLDPNFDAISLEDFVSTEVLNDISEDIQAGVEPGTNKPQRELNPKGYQGRRAKKGLRPNVRGFTDRKTFVDSLTRTRISARKSKGVATYATCKIKPKAQFSAWLTRELARGVDYFSVDLDKIDRAVDKWVSLAMENANPSPNEGEKKANT